MQMLMSDLLAYLLRTMSPPIGKSDPHLCLATY